ncbi:hypothetical protein GPECTOR_11g130 [Gonium pectorale]|uniref:SHSP domain-containing protein n=1 Tax=Gonium pectorale TaxID=33097 RepID=A0A150GPB2_GONPE|nr:hypothetical protein GPECTOR_11g130 [Gonium pectorale]|eukprot:KXZ51679.1 hypothetical protein GPECTOR_11g130 [Gonium pectorale]
MLASEWLREATSSVHPMDIKAFDDRYEIHSDVPGMAEEDVEVEISPDRVLTIAGSRKTARQGPSAPKPSTNEAAGAADDATLAASSDRASTEPAADVAVSYRFRRSFVLPEDAEVEGVAANLQRGVLTVTVPRRVVEKPQPRRVRVKGAK